VEGTLTMIGGGGFVFFMGSFGYKKLSKWYGTQGTRKFLLGQRKKERKKERNVVGLGCVSI